MPETLCCCFVKKMNGVWGPFAKARERNLVLLWKGLPDSNGFDSPFGHHIARRIHVSIVPSLLVWCLPVFVFVLLFVLLSEEGHVGRPIVQIV